MSGVKAFIVFPMDAFHLSVVTGCKWPDHFVPDPVGFQVFLKKSRLIPMGGKAVGELTAIVCLDAFDPAGERFYQMLHELCGRIRIMFLKSFHKTPSGILINGSVLEELFPDHPAVFQAGGRNKFDIHLDTLPGIVHFLIKFGNILRVGRVDGHDALLAKETVKSGNRAGITSLPEFHPENNESGIGIASAHITNQFDFFGSMLIGMKMRSAGTIAKGVPGTIIAAFPTINILSVGFIFDSGFSDAKFLSVFDEG